jgi:predicted RND superfamily exporter protein
MVIIGAFFAFMAPQAELSKNIHEGQPTTIPTYKQLEKVKQNFNYSEDFLLCTAGSEADLYQTVEGFWLVDEVLNVESVLSYLPSDQEEKLALIEQAKQTHPELAAIPAMNLTKMHWTDLPPSLTENWVKEKDGGLVFLIRVTAKGDIYDEKYRTALVEDLSVYNGNISGQAIMWPKLLDNITGDVINVSIYAAIPILLITFIGLRKKNPLYALIAFVPVLCGIFGILALYRFLDIQLNFISVIVMPLIIGIGIDDGIHIVHRYLEEGKASMSRVINSTGKAVFLTTATTCLAFSSFIFAQHPGMQSLGRVPVLGLTLCFIASVTFVPALGTVILDRFTKKVEHTGHE